MPRALRPTATVLVSFVALALLPTSPAVATASDGWDVPNGSVNARGAVVLNDGHVDIASVLEDGGLATRIKDSATADPPVMRLPERTVLQLLPGAARTVPDNPAYAFLGAPGDTFWQLSERQEDGLLWPGWSTEALPVTATDTGVDWRLTDVDGPGDFVLYTASPAQLGRLDVKMSTRDGITAADTVAVPKNTHAHGAWAFSAEGTYCLGFERSTVLTRCRRRRPWVASLGCARADRG